MKQYTFLIWIWCMIWYTFGICLVYKKWQKMTMTENVWSDFTYSSICVVYKKTGMLTVKRLFCFTISMLNTRCYKKWLFLTGICLYTTKQYMYSDLFYLLCIWRKLSDQIILMTTSWYKHGMRNMTGIPFFIDFLV